MKDSDINNILKDDGVAKVDLDTFVNLNNMGLDSLKQKLGTSGWAARVAHNDRFQSVLICQAPGEGNRKHYHPDSDEFWYIVDGELEWWIDGHGTRKVSKGDFVCVKAKVGHQITCVGDKPAIRLAIVKPDVEHVYLD